MQPGDISLVMVLRERLDSDTQSARDRARVRIEAAEEVVIAAARILKEVHDGYPGLRARERNKLNNLRQQLTDFRRPSEFLRVEIQGFEDDVRSGVYDDELKED